MNKTLCKTDTDPDRSADLWSFAVSCYAIEQAHLLSLQHSACLHINDALVAAYAAAGALPLDDIRWQSVRSGRPRHVLYRVRRFRQQMSRTDPNRALALAWELELERWDLMQLAGCLRQADTGSDEDDYLARLLSEQCELSVKEADDLLGRLQRSAQCKLK